MRFGTKWFMCSVAVLVFMAGNAFAQTAVVTSADSSSTTYASYTAMGWTVVDSLDAAFQVTSVQRILVTKGKWASTTDTVPAGVTIRGLGSYPYDVVIDGSGMTDATLYFTASSTGSSIENLTISGGPAGVKIESSCNVEMDQCYIRDNKGHGIVCAGEVTLTNCSVSGNTGDGVHVENTATADAAATISFCSILYNGGSGVNARIGAGASSTTSTATVRYSLVTQNGAGGTISGGVFTLDTSTSLNTNTAINPYWEVPGEWAYGLPTGEGGGTVGYPDPSVGATGSYVLGVNLSGNYSLPTSAATDTTTSVAQALPVSATQSYSLTAPTGTPAPTLGDLNCSLTLTLDQDNMLKDLSVNLVHSSGVSATLFTGSALTSLAPVAGTYTLLFDDEATTAVSVATDMATLATGVKPQAALSVFDGVNGGTWSLQVVNSASNTGTVGNVTLSVSPMMFLTVHGLDFTLYSNPSMRFARWLNMDATSRAVIEVSTDGGTNWTNIWTKGDVAVTDRTWNMQEVTLPSAATNNANVAVRWGYYAHSGDTACSGWNIDDISFRGTLSGDASAGLKSDGTAVITPKQNLVKFPRGGTNYDNVTEDTASTTEAALATSLDALRLEKDNSTWNGKLATDTPYSVLKDRVSVTSITSSDFEHDERVAPLDIGADEISSGSGLLWEQCKIQPSTYYISTKAVNELSVEFLFRGLSSTVTFATYSSGTWSTGYRVYLLTNARNATLNPSVTTDYAQMNVIPLNITRTSDSDIVFGSNALAITTVGRVDSSSGTDIPIINDGAGHIVIDDGEATPTQVVPYGQAATGRNFVIDTQAPWLVLNSTAASNTANYFASGAAAYDTRLIERPADGYGAKAFYSATSFGPTVTATMSDAFPYFMVATGALPASGIVTSGFSPSSAGTYSVSGETAINNMLFSGVISGNQSYVFWFPDGDWSVLGQVNSTASVTYSFPISGDNRVLTSVWTLPGDLISSASSLLDTYQIPIHFKGIDVIGNTTVLTNALDPVELWWMREVHTQLQPGPINGEFKQPHFSWKLLRRVEPYPELASASDTARLAICPTWPTYQLRLMYLNSSQYNLVLSPVSAGMATSLPFSWFQAKGIMTNVNCINNWLLLVASAANDEAGNAETWPFAASSPVPDSVATPYVFGGVGNAGTDGWEVFIPNANATFDTAASAVFWYDTNSDLTTIENSMGNRARIPYSAANSFAGSFTVNFRSSNGSQPGDQIEWKLWIENKGTTLNPLTSTWGTFDSGTATVYPAGSVTFPHALPFAASTLLPLGTGDSLRFPIHYKFVAWAIRGGTTDKTPAEVSFTVVDPTQEDVTVDTQQPVKVHQIK